MQPGMLFENFIHAANLVTKEHQRVVTNYQHDQKKYMGNPMYGRFQALGLAWKGAPAVSGIKLAVERDQIISKNKKQSRYEGIYMADVTITSDTPAAEGNAKARNKMQKLQPLRQVQGPKPKPAWK